MDKQTTTGTWQIKQKDQVVWYEPPKPRRGEELLKNLGVASALVLCAVTLKTGAILGATSMTDAVVASVSDDTLLDDRLGKLSFVSTLFPEATLVFGESNDQALSVPVNAGIVVHTWSEAEPYTTWRSAKQEVYASTSGVVMGVYHGENEERLVQVTNADGLSCLYGNLENVNVQVGEEIKAGELLGCLLPGEDCVLQVMQDGISVDPAGYFMNVT